MTLFRCHFFNLFILLLTLALASSCQLSKKETSLLSDIQNKGKLTVGVNYGNPPFGHYAEHNGQYQLEGFDIALSEAISEKLLPQSSVKPIEFRQVLTSTRLVAINTHSVDMIAASMSITPARKQRVAFSKPYFTVHQKLLVKKNSQIHHIQDLSNKTILTINGSTAQARLKKNYPHIKLKGYSTLQEAFSALQHNEGDALSNDDVLLQGLLNQHCALASQFKLLPDELSNEYYGLVFEKNPRTKTLREKVDQILNSLERDGTLEHLQQTWLRQKCHS